MQLKRYEFGLGRFGKILDEHGNEENVRLADDDAVEKLLAGDGKETSPSEVRHALVRAEQDKFQKIGYVEALERVRNKNPQLMRLYASESAGCLRVY